MSKKLVFFPSLSSGNSRGWLERNREIHPGLSCRFYEKGYPNEMYHPYFLLSAGNLYKNMDIRNKMGLQDAFVIGDSGGYQISTGSLKWKPELRGQIFDWLENNSDIAMNIDIPTRGLYDNHFNEALKLSIDNFRYFDEHQTGKTKYLNVLQGICESKAQGQEWYDAMKDFRFDGWAIGGFKTIDSILYSIAFLLDNKELDKDRNKYIHYLGATSPLHALLFTMLQNAFNKRYTDRYQITTDSSSPNLATIFGTYYLGVNWNTVSMNSITIGKKHNLNLSEQIPCSIGCKICEGVTFQDISKFDEYQYMILTHHNMVIFKQMFDFSYKLLQCHDDIIKEFLSTDLYRIYESINEMFASDDPMRIYNDNALLYRMSGYNENLSVDTELAANYFDIEPEPILTKQEIKKQAKLNETDNTPIDYSATITDIETFFED